MREREQRLERVITNAPFPAVIHAEGGEILQVNKAFTEVSGYAGWEVPTIAAWTELAYGNRQDVVRVGIERLYELEGRLDEGEFVIRARDGSKRVWQFSSAALGRLADGRRTIVSMAVDVTKRRQAEEDLRASEARYRSVYDSAGVGFASYARDGRLVDANQYFFDLIGYSRAESLGSAIWEVVHPTDREPMWHQFERLLAGESVASPQERRYLRKNDSYVWVEVDFSAIGNGTDEPQQLLAVVRDITERKQVEAARARAEQLHQELVVLEKILENAMAGYWDWDIPNNREYLSPGFKRMLGYRDSELPNAPESWQRLIFPEDLSGALEGLERHIRSHGREPYYNEVRYRHKDGSTVWVICTGQVIEWDAQGNPLRAVGCHIDITQLKQAELILKARTEELETFAYSVSHDLRAPLRAIDGFSQALLEDYGDLFAAEGKDFFGRIRSNIARMGQLIDDLLQLSRISRVELQAVPVDLGTVAREILADLQAAEPQRSVEVEIALEVPVVSADATLICLILSNLLGNAWKFTSRRSETQIKFVSVRAADGTVTCSVKDNGTGFSMDYASKLFGVFQRLHAADEFPGTGVGLAIVQRAIYRLGGTIWAESAVDRGATFYFSLPKAD